MILDSPTFPFWNLRSAQEVRNDDRAASWKDGHVPAAAAHPANSNLLATDGSQTRDAANVASQRLRYLPARHIVSKSTRRLAASTRRRADLQTRDRCRTARQTRCARAPDKCRARCAPRS